MINYYSTVTQWGQHPTEKPETLRNQLRRLSEPRNPRKNPEPFADSSFQKMLYKVWGLMGLRVSFAVALRASVKGLCGV